MSPKAALTRRKTRLEVGGASRMANFSCKWSVLTCLWDTRTEGLAIHYPRSWCVWELHLFRNLKMIPGNHCHLLAEIWPLNPGTELNLRVKAMVFPVVEYGCGSWTVKKAECWRTDAFELWCWRRLLRVFLDCKETQPVHPKGNQSWIFTGRTDTEAETPILWPPDVRNWLIWKDPDAGKDWGQEEKRMTEDETVGWHHWLNGHEF